MLHPEDHEPEHPAINDVNNAAYEISTETAFVSFSL